LNAVFTNTILADTAGNIAVGLALVHNNYFTVTPQDPGNLSYTDTSGVKYVLSPTYPVPAETLNPSADAGVRQLVEQAYNRIFGSIPAPPQDVSPAVSTALSAAANPAPVLRAQPTSAAAPPVTSQGSGGLTPSGQQISVINSSQLQALNAQLQQGNNLTQVAQAAETLANINSTTDPTWTVTVYDNLWRPIGPVGGDLIDLTGTDPWNNLPSATLKIKGASTLISQFMQCRTTLVGITVETAGLRFPFYVDTFDYEFKDDQWIGTANLKGIWDILNFYQIWPDWYLPIQAQLFSYACFIGALCTVIESMVATTALRLQAGINEFLNNVLSLNPDISAWFGTLLQDNGNIAQMLQTPVYVVRTDPYTDTSPLMVKTVKMQSCGTVITEITKPYGVDCHMDLWLPGDPQPDQWTGAYPNMALTQPTYVFSTKDRSQITGPTKTVLDSVIRTVVDLEGSLLGNVLDPLLNPTGIDEGVLSPLPQGMFIAPALGVDYVAPWAVLVAPEPGMKGSVETCKITFHTPKGWQHIIGGRSPKWLNDLMNATYSWIIDSISILIGFTGIPSNLLDGFLNDIFLAFQLVEAYARRAAVGPYHPCIEVFHATESSPYDIETLFGFIDALWDSRGYVCAQTTIRNGEVYTLGKDIFRGSLISLLFNSRTQMYTDFIENIMFHISETERDLLIQIGDGRALESPLAKHERNITGLFESINVVTLAPQS
jgi:hypothetical protein